MTQEQITEAVMELPEEERLELARRIVSGVAFERQRAKQIAAAVRGIEDIVTGKVRGLNEAEFRQALK